MRHNTIEKVKWFVRNLDLLIKDLDLKRQQVDIETYFDTSDVRDIVLGMHAFLAHDDDEFQIQKFSLERTLVDCLAASGRLGSIDMLPPHQSEFLVLLNLDFGVPSLNVPPTELASQFLQSIPSLRNTDFSTVPLEIMTNEEILMFVRQSAGSAVDLFKAVQCIRGTNWMTRLINLRENGVLNLKIHNNDYKSILESKEFVRLKKAFDELRPSSLVSNFADAVAVVCLITLVDDFKYRHSPRVPNLFISSPIFLSAIERAGVGHLLTYKTQTGGDCSVLRNADYYVFKSTFLTARDPSCQYDQDMRLDKTAELKELRLQLGEILQAQYPLDSELIDKIKFSGIPLGEIIDDLQQFSFFENVWLSSSAKNEIVFAQREISDATRYLDSKRFQRGVKEAIEATKKALADNVYTYRLLRHLWEDFEQARSRTLFRLRDYPTPNPNYFRDFGLFRFGFPENTHLRINNILEALFSGDEELNKYACSAVFNTCLTLNKNRDKEVEELAVAASVLWILEVDAQIITLVEGIKKPPHFSLQIMYASALFRRKENVNGGKHILSRLVEEYKSANGQPQCADMAIGLSYLFFQLRSCLGIAHPWHSNSETVSNTHIAAQQLAENAIQFAHEAYLLLGPQNDMLKVYALNQYLYCLVEAGQDSLRADMDTMARQLAVYKAERTLWGYKYDETLSRYFYRLATLEENEANWFALMHSARNHIEAATRESYGDKETAAYQTFLAVEFAAGFYKGRKNA